jgi:AcrR family transcriptional regulator
MPTRSDSKRRRLSPERRRELILDGAMRVFAERGYEAASMEGIAEAAGITPAVIYDHFQSKAKLYVELLERQTAALLDHVGTALLTAPADAATRMRIGVDAFFAFVEKHRFTWRMLFRDPPSDPEVAAAYARLERQATAGIAAFIEAGAEDALAHYADRERALQMFAEALKAAQNGLAAWWYEHPEVPREEVVERLLEFCWVGLERVAKGRGGGDR